MAGDSGHSIGSQAVEQQLDTFFNILLARAFRRALRRPRIFPGSSPHFDPTHPLYIGAQIAQAGGNQSKWPAFPIGQWLAVQFIHQQAKLLRLRKGERRGVLAVGRLKRLVIGIELLAAAQGCDFHRPLASSPPLEAVRTLLRRDVPHLEDDRHFHPDIEKATALVASGTIVATVGSGFLPALEETA